MAEFIPAAVMGAKEMYERNQQDKRLKAQQQQQSASAQAQTDSLLRAQGQADAARAERLRRQVGARRAGAAGAGIGGDGSGAAILSGLFAEAEADAAAARETVQANLDAIRQGQGFAQRIDLLQRQDRDWRVLTAGARRAPGLGRNLLD